MRILLLVLIVLLGLGGGAGLGVALRPAPAEAPPPAEATTPAPDTAGSPEDAGREYVKFGRRMIVPIVEGAETRALMVFEIAIDAGPQAVDAVYARKPRLRDAFLRDMFQMAHAGAFSATYTEERVMTELREKLLATARAELGNRVHGVLILDAVRKEM